MSEWIEVLDKNDIELDRDEINVWIEANEFGNRYLVIPVEFIAEILNQNSAAKDEALAALTERVAELEARNKWWLENYDITMPCGHKNRYLDVDMKGELVRDENGDAVCTMCIVEAR